MHKEEARMAAQTAHRTIDRLVVYLDDICFPCSCREILARAEDNDAPDVLLDAIEDLPERSYWSISDIMLGLLGDSGQMSCAQPTPAPVTSPEPTPGVAGVVSAPASSLRPLSSPQMVE